VPLPRSLGRLNRRATNRVLGPIVAWLPGFGLLEHRGRRTGTRHATPVLGFRRGDRIVFAATYGPASDWVANVLAAGGATFLSRRRRIVLTDPRLVHDPSRRLVPRVVRPGLRLLRAADFVIGTVAADGGRTSRT
jgi:deazaflavin-dependent oxidoreductase (nitroreductase family)